MHIIISEGNRLSIDSEDDDYQVLVERFADVEISLGGHNDHAVHAARQSNLQTGDSQSRYLDK